MPGPIRPKDIIKIRTETFPQEIFQVFNQLISEAWDGKEAQVYQKTVIERLVKLGLHEDQIWKKHYLDIGAMYEKVGWKVRYEKPSWDESFDAYFLFKKE